MTIFPGDYVDDLNLPRLSWRLNGEDLIGLQSFYGCDHRLPDTGSISFRFYQKELDGTAALPCSDKSCWYDFCIVNNQNIRRIKEIHQVKKHVMRYCLGGSIQMQQS